MSTIDTVPKQPSAEPPSYDDEKGGSPVSRSRPGSFIDEKYVEKPLSEIDSADIGDVFAEGPRLIDIGEDGKERPIGEWSYHICCPVEADMFGLVPLRRD